MLCLNQKCFRFNILFKKMIFIQIKSAEARDQPSKPYQGNKYGVHQLRIIYTSEQCSRRNIKDTVKIENQQNKVQETKNHNKVWNQQVALQSLSSTNSHMSFNQFSVCNIYNSTRTTNHHLSCMSSILKRSSLQEESGKRHVDQKTHVQKTP